MKTLEIIHPEAVEKTKQKVVEDLYRYLGEHETIRSFDDYVHDRKEYLDQIWINVWINRASNQISRKLKREYLENLGYEVEGVSRKFINSIFRTEIREYKPFDPVAWLDEKYNQPEKWKKTYEKARERYLEQLEIERRQKEQDEILAQLDEVIEERFEANELFYFLKCRHFIAKKLARDFTEKKKYKKTDIFALEHPLIEEGPFREEHYSSFAHFLEELTGGIHKTFYRGRHHFVYETYEDLYENELTAYILNFIPSHLLEGIDEQLLRQYEETFEEPLQFHTLATYLEDDLRELAADYFEDLKDDDVSHLLSLASVPFEHETHDEIFEENLISRDEKRKKEKKRKAREREEEKIMIEDIFSREYRPQIRKNIQYVLHIGETNTGKTYHALKRMKEAESGLYLAPLRLLALEVYDKLNKEGVPCTLKTGEEEKITEGARHLSCTVEMFREKDFYDCIVIDEAQMMADRDRGYAWYRAISKANAKEVHIIGSRNVRSMVEKILGDANIEVKEYFRDIPLKVEKKPFQFSKIKKGDALVCFSRKRVLETASRVQGDGFRVSMIYGSMPPETRKKEMERFLNNETDVIVATDAIGMGLNLPIRRIVFLENEKFDGVKRRRLTSQEVKQIAGRAGRKGIYDVGRVAFMSDVAKMKKLLLQEDEPIHTFAIAPTGQVFDRFQKYSRDLGTFFRLWEQFESPPGTEKASLAQEKELYELIRGTVIEARLSLTDLYSFLHLPFSVKDPGLAEQWFHTMMAIVNDEELPEPKVKTSTLSQQELSYKSISLHLLFLYRLDRRIEATYWEKVREELSETVAESLQTEVEQMRKKCRRCGKPLSWEHEFAICDECYYRQYERW